ncbi:MAG: type II toxin-antitoxin system PemK/MazF family toxin [Nanoarchaeota archaeon]|nr:type II toxin-antitoxin system PemK/MazF family toxin [Nanoarchaeota archaeon]
MHNNESIRPGFYEREIWYCHLGENVGFEQDGKGDDYLRPVVIIKKFNNEIFWGIPLTSTIKKSKYYFMINFSENNEKSSAILSQIKLIDAKRLSYKIGVVETGEFKLLTKKLKDLIP